MARCRLAEQQNQLPAKITNKIPKNKVTNSISINQETQAITRFEALAHEIAIAEQEGQDKEFDYESKPGEKAARSYIYNLRKIKGSIERARKDAKDVHLRRGRAVDDAAKQLESRIQGLIAPHEAEIKKIEAREEARIDLHRAVLNRISQLTEGITTTAEAHQRLVELASIDTTTLEEFANAGANRVAEAGERLKAIWEELLVREQEQAELAALRAEKAQREEAEKIERIRQEAAAEALAAAAEAEQRAVEAEQRAVEAEARAATVTAAAEIAEIEAIPFREAFILEVSQRMAGKNRREIATSIVDGILHPAILIDWSKVAQ